MRILTQKPVRGLFRDGVAARNPAWVQLLGLCPLLAVSTSVVNALGLALASGGVLLGANISVSLLRRWIPDFARLPAFVLIIATFTTCAVLLLEAYAFDLYLGIALFVQIIVTNCMILGRVESFASRTSAGRAAADALGTASGFALALLAMGAARELLGQGTLFANMDLLFGPSAAPWQLTVPGDPGGLLIVLLPPGAFILAGLLLGAGRVVKDKVRL
jgi:electron transport complex protein RnfE